MALDPSIILHAGAGVPSMADVQARFEQVKQAKLQNAAAEQAQQDAQATRQAFKQNMQPDATLNEEGLLKDIAATGNLKTWEDLNNYFQTKRQQKFQAAQAQIEAKRKHLDTLDELTASAVDQPSYLEAVKRAHDLGLDISGLPAAYNPALVASARQRVLGGKGYLAELEAKIKAEAEANKPKLPQSSLGKINADLASGLITPEQAKAAIKEELAPKAKASTSGGINFMGQDFDPNKPLPPALESAARAVAETGQRLTPSSRNPQAWLVNARADAMAAQGGGTVGQAKQQFQTAQDARKYWTTGQGAAAFRQQETILHHADTFIKIAEALDSGNIQLANKLGASVGAQFGNDKATNYKIVSKIMSSEVGKYLAGGQSTESERSELSDLIPVFSSPQQAKSGLNTLKTLVEGQRKSWTAQRDAALKGNVPGMEKGSTATRATATGPNGQKLQLSEDGTKWEVVK